MNRICGHPLAGSQTCRQPVADPAKPDCGRHRAGPPQTSIPPLDKSGCRMQESAPGTWRCSVHSELEWETAQALGAKVPCRVPLPREKREELAEGSNDPGTLRMLAGDPVLWIRRRVAMNPSTPVALLDQLAGDPEWWVRQGVAENPSTPASVLVRLAKDPDEDVALAARKRVPS